MVEFPILWYNAEVLLKKRENTNLTNYRLITLLSHLYTFLAKILTIPLSKKLDFYQLVEQDTTTDIKEEVGLSWFRTAEVEKRMEKS